MENLVKFSIVYGQKKNYINLFRALIFTAIRIYLVKKRKRHFHFLRELKELF